MELISLIEMFIKFPALIQDQEVIEILKSDLPIDKMIDAIGRNGIVRLKGN